jgi:ABC-type uncharacterized transport system permease subunit
MDPAAAAIIGVQVALLAGLGIYAGWTVSKNAPVGEYNSKFWWNVARTVVVFLPMALAWFGLFCGMFLQAIDLVLPVIVGVAAVGLNFAIDFGVSSGSFGVLWSYLIYPFIWLLRRVGLLKQVTV